MTLLSWFRSPLRAAACLASAVIMTTTISATTLAQQGSKAPASGDKESAPATATTKTGGTSKDTFTPSEEVSEDLSVSFPVDI